ncbi:hypothetical protein [Fodinicurvata sp. EGI_FJ10296]|uniref:hypothetical protein n=1 Tax=Fodinicurvata sp. EGI_FJ10296 TaxID=3231908 RepID=UPI003451630A
MPDPASINDLGQGDAEDIAWLVIETLAQSNDAASAFVTIGHLLRNAHGLKDDGEHTVIKNPLFLSHGFSGMSPRTRSYITDRGVKSFGSSVASVASGAASAVTMVDVAGLALHGSAVGTTGAHIMGIKASGKGFRNSQTIMYWMDAMLKAKYAKLAVRGTGLAGAAIPIPAVGLGVTIASTVAKLGIKVTLGKLIARVAMEVHWRAYQENKINSILPGRSAGLAVGPASAMFVEIFTRRGLTRIFGQYDVDSFMKEPGGWMALNDKLMLM